MTKRRKSAPDPQTVIAARMAHAQQRAIFEYRRYLREHVLPNPIGGSRKAQVTARRSLLNSDSIELLIYPWRFSPYVTVADIEAAGLEPRKPGEDDFVTRRAMGRMLWRQYGDDDHEPYERRASRAAAGWLIYGLVTQEKVKGRENLKKLRGAKLLDGLMRAYFLTYAKEASPDLARGLLQKEPSDG
jgi:hypothetical protein